MSGIVGRPLTNLETFSIAEKLTKALVKCEQKPRETDTLGRSFQANIVIPAAVRVAGFVAVPFAALADVFMHLAFAVGKALGMPLKICVKSKELQASSPLVHLINTVRSITNIVFLSLLSLGDPTAAYRMAKIGRDQKAPEQNPDQESPAEELGRLANNLVRLQQQVEDYQARLDRNNEFLEAFEEQEATHNDAMLRATHRIEVKDRAITALREQLEGLVAQGNEKDEEINNLKQRIADLEDEIDHMYDDNQSQASDNSELSQQSFVVGYEEIPAAIQPATVQVAEQHNVEESDESLIDEEDPEQMGESSTGEQSMENDQTPVVMIPPPITASQFIPGSHLTLSQLHLPPPPSEQFDDFLAQSLVVDERIDESQGEISEFAAYAAIEATRREVIRDLNKRKHIKPRNELPQHIQLKLDKRIEQADKLTLVGLKAYSAKSDSIYKSLLMIKTDGWDIHDVQQDLSESQYNMAASMIHGVKQQPVSLDDHLQAFVYLLAHVKVKMGDYLETEKAAKEADEARIVRERELAAEQKKLEERNKRLQQIAAISFVTKRYETMIDVEKELDDTMNSAAINLIFQNNNLKEIKNLATFKIAIGVLKEQIEKLDEGTYLETDLFKEAKMLMAVFNEGKHLRIKQKKNIVPAGNTMISQAAPAATLAESNGDWDTDPDYVNK